MMSGQTDGRADGSEGGRTAVTYPLFRVFGVALAVAAVDPPHGFLGSDSPQVAVLLALFAIWAAAPVVRRPVLTVHRWVNQFARNRNTIFAGTCTVAAAAGRPALWLMIADAALLLGYLLALDSISAGPIGARQLRTGWPVGLAAAGTAMVLALARLSTSTRPSTFGESGRWLASAGAILAGGALTMAFLPRRSRAERAAEQAEAADAQARAQGKSAVTPRGSKP